MRRLLGVMVLAVGLAAVPPGVGAMPLGQTGCQVTAGFRALRDQLGDIVGQCLEEAHAEATTGNVLQRTTGGLLVWRPRGNWTGFTDGYKTWTLGPFGLQQRLSTERFDWEDAVAPIAVPSGPAPASPASQIPAFAPTAQPPAPVGPQQVVAPAQTPPAIPLPPTAVPVAAAPVPASCQPVASNDDASRPAPLNGAADGVLPPAIWSRSGDQPDRIAHRYYAFSTTSGAGIIVGVSVGDEGGYKVRANVYGPDGVLDGSVLVGANERQEIPFTAPIAGQYTVQLSSYRPVEVPFHLDVRRSV